MPKVSDEHKELRIQQILLAASEVFKSKGYEQATLKDIVEEAGMSRGWIYLYFKDKINHLPCFDRLFRCTTRGANIDLTKGK